MSSGNFRQWLGPLIVSLTGLLAALFARLNWIPNYVFKGVFELNLSALLLFTGLLAGVIWGGAVLSKRSMENKIKLARDVEKAAQVSDRQRFLRRLDHELKNPLTTIGLGITNLQEGANAGGEMDMSLQRISLQAQRLRVLVENLRRLSEMDEKSLDRSQVDLGDVLEEAVELARVAPESAGTVHLTVQQVPWPLSPINGDRDLLMVAFRNLVENALKFSGERGRVEVRAFEDGRNVMIEIDDNGRGIPPEDLAFIFDELYRAENARDLPGSGLGLSLAQRIVELHGGSLRVNSRLEQGTMVRVQLPIHPQ